MIFLEGYYGRLGNKMLQFASMYALSRRTGYKLFVPPIEEFCLTAQEVGSIVHRTEANVYRIPSQAGNHLDYSRLDVDPKRTMRREAYWENIYNFDGYREDLKRIFQLPSPPLRAYQMYEFATDKYIPIEVDSIFPSDLVISLRLGDFLQPLVKTNPPHRLLLYDYFNIVIANCKHQRLFITSDEPFHPFVNEFREHRPILVENHSPLATMAFVVRFSKIAISQSTFSWWCAYLSDAPEIYYPIPKTGPWSIGTRWTVPDLYLRPHTDAYKYVHYRSGEVFTWKDAPGRRDHDDF